MVWICFMQPDPPLWSRRVCARGEGCGTLKPTHSFPYSNFHPQCTGSHWETFRMLKNHNFFFFFFFKFHYPILMSFSEWMWLKHTALPAWKYHLSLKNQQSHCCMPPSYYLLQPGRCWGAVPEQHLPGRALRNPWLVQVFQQAPAAKQCPSVLKTSLLWVIRNPMTAFFWKRGWKHWALHLFPAAVIGLIGWNRMRYFHSQNSEDSSRFSNPTERGGKISYYSSRGEKWLNSAWSRGSDSLAHGPLQCHLVFHRACYPLPSGHRVIHLPASLVTPPSRGSFIWYSSEQLQDLGFSYSPISLNLRDWEQ